MITYPEKWNINGKLYQTEGTYIIGKFLFIAIVFID